jgi:hypothetical protein
MLSRRGSGRTKENVKSALQVKHVVQGNRLSPVRLRLIATGFVAGALVHTAWLLATVLHREVLPGYPAWRHALFAAVDFTIACVAVCYPRLLVLPLVAVPGQQLSTHGVQAWHAWADQHELRAYDLAVLGFLIVAVAVSAAYAVSARPLRD